jgi:hypothetical protein
MPARMSNARPTSSDAISAANHACQRQCSGVAVIRTTTLLVRPRTRIRRHKRHGRCIAIPQPCGLATIAVCPDRQQAQRFADPSAAVAARRPTWGAAVSAMSRIAWRIRRASFPVARKFTFDNGCSRSPTRRLGPAGRFSVAAGPVGSGDSQHRKRSDICDARTRG